MDPNWTQADLLIFTDKENLELSDIFDHAVIPKNHCNIINKKAKRNKKHFAVHHGYCNSFLTFPPPQF